MIADEIKQIGPNAGRALQAERDKNYTKAIDIRKKNLALLYEIEEEFPFPLSSVIASIQYQIGLSYSKLFDYKEAAKHFFEAFENRLKSLARHSKMTLPNLLSPAAMPEKDYIWVIKYICAASKAARLSNNFLSTRDFLSHAIHDLRKKHEHLIDEDAIKPLIEHEHKLHVVGRQALIELINGNGNGNGNNIVPTLRDYLQIEPEHIFMRIHYAQALASFSSTPKQHRSYAQAIENYELVFSSLLNDPAKKHPKTTQDFVTCANLFLTDGNGEDKENPRSLNNICIHFFDEHFTLYFTALCEMREFTKAEKVLSVVTSFFTEADKLQTEKIFDNTRETIKIFEYFIRTNLLLKEKRYHESQAVCEQAITRQKEPFLILDRIAYLFLQNHDIEAYRQLEEFRATLSEFRSDDESQMKEYYLEQCQKLLTLFDKFKTSPEEAIMEITQMLPTFFSFTESYPHITATDKFDPCPT